MTTLTNIAFDVTPTSPDLPMGLVIELDGKILWQMDAVTETCHVTVPVDDTVEGEHQLRWLVSNKLPHYTVLDDEGNITQDSMLHIDNLTIDEIDITQLLNTCATYTHDFNGTGVLQTDTMYQDLGCNGVGELKFKTPVYLWLLENM